MTCREEILEMIEQLMREPGRVTFTAREVAQRMRAAGTSHKELSIRTYVTYWMCAEPDQLSDNRTADLERVSRGQYRLRQLSKA
ncbi:DUF7669 domain-containing protein [Deinococcus knuensis]|uniref:DUF7669 domain-containing protein n=1 Tax=Deinococcus knuensis TaxID=1837380 RepID=A0ABQ2SPX4_9DEIO|nr:hypothetical protein [Deinococcus knuensis]GGS36483.1 hypothetical protein GCM10008961_30170 [Deinococcus knuensis]